MLLSNGAFHFLPMTELLTIDSGCVIKEHFRGHGNVFAELLTV